MRTFAGRGISRRQSHRVLHRAFADIILIALAMLAVGPAAFAQSDNAGVPKIVIDPSGSNMTPLAKGFSTAAQHGRDKARTQGNSNCQDPASSDTPGQRRGKAGACNVADVSVINAPDPANCPDCGSNPLPGSSGVHLKNQATISYTSPSQRVDKDGQPLQAWPPLAINPNRVLPLPFQDANGKTIDPSIEDNSGRPIATKVSDPNALSGYMANAAQIDPKTTTATHFTNNLTNVPLSAGDCFNFGSGKTFTARDGTGKPVTTGNGAPVAVTLPQQGFGTLNPDGTCDVSRAMVVAMNGIYGQSKGDSSKLAFDADSNGVCNTDPTKVNGNAAMKCGQERRTQHVTEDVIAHCPPSAQYVDGVCVKANNGQPSPLSVARLNSLAIPSSSGSLLQDNYAMMGFTVAPPEVSWGYSTEEDACVDLGFTDVCVTVFAAKVGYDFDLGVGLRLPVQLEVTSGSSTTAGNTLSVLAGKSLTLNTSLTAQDFTAQQFTDFCNNNGIADGLLVADCNTFAFPEFFSSLFHDVDSSVPVDGEEFAAKWVIFAGAKVVVMDVPVIDVGIDSAGNIPTLCSLGQLWDNKFGTAGSTAFDDVLSALATYPNLSGLGTDTLKNLLKELKAHNVNCGSFTTPFGGIKNIDGSAVVRKFPFLLGSGLHLYADCVKASKQNLFIQVGTKTKPFCTGLYLEYAGATLGIGLTLHPDAGSSQISASARASGDGSLLSGGTADLAFTQVVNNNVAGDGAITVNNPPIGPVFFDNYDTSTDSARINVDNFTYLLNTFGLELDANLEFGGILSPLPDLPSFPIFTVTFNLGSSGIPIPEHHGEKPISVPVFVQNYALSAVGSPVVSTTNPLLPAAQNPLNSAKPALGIKPGRGSATFNFQLKNEGSVAGNFEHFQAVLPDTTGNFPFLTAGWTATFANATASGNAHSATGPNSVTVTPLKDPSTRPQVYPITLKADSTEAFDNQMAAVDPSGIHRLGASDTVYVNILPYFDPRITSAPTSSSAKPGAAAQSYSITVQNHGNAPDQFRLSYQRVDFNTAGCTLTTLGGAGCPYRAVPTVIQAAWDTASGLTTLFDGPQLNPPAGNVPVLATRPTGFSIGVPSTWAGMTDTTYTLPITVTSLIDDGAPPASNVVNITQTVIATKQSMTRYIDLELADLATQIQNANAAGTNSGGSLPIIINDVEAANARALTSILSGNLSGASNTLGAEIQSMQGFLKAINGPSIPPALLADWTARANAIIRDMGTAQASNVTSQ